MIQELQQIAREAGAIALKFYGNHGEVDIKENNSPVTQADLAVNEFIMTELGSRFPDIPILSEETADDKERMESSLLFTVDPIDGTKDFINGLENFSVIIGVVEQQRPIAGVVYKPVTDELYWAEKGQGAWKKQREHVEQICVSKETETRNFRAGVSVFHSNKTVAGILDDLGIIDQRKIGSIGVKVCAIAEGALDLYINPSHKSNEWDTSAPDIIISEAGGKLTDLKGNPLLYNQEDVQHKDGLLGSNGLAHAELCKKIEELKTI